jgi:hypothetical protein
MEFVIRVLAWWQCLSGHNPVNYRVFPFETPHQIPHLGNAI